MPRFFRRTSRRRTLDKDVRSSLNVKRFPWNVSIHGDGFLIPAQCRGDNLPGDNGNSGSVATDFEALVGARLCATRHVESRGSDERNFPWKRRRADGKFASAEPNFAIAGLIGSWKELQVDAKRINSVRPGFITVHNSNDASLFPHLVRNLKSILTTSIHFSLLQSASSERGSVSNSSLVEQFVERSTGRM